MIDPSFLRKKNRKWRFPLFAVLFHVAVIGGLIILEIQFRRQMIRDEVNKIFQVKQITQEELDALMSRRRVVDTEIAKNQEATKGQKAYLGETTQRVKQETVNVGKNQAKVDGADKDRQEKKGKGFGAKVPPEQRSKRHKGASYDIISLDPSLSISPRTYLNTDAYVYASFSNRLREIIGVPWAERTTKIYEKNKNEFGVGIYFTTAKYFFTKQGVITNVVVTRASGIAELDKAAVDSIYGAKRIENPPSYLFVPPFDGSLEFSFYFYVVPGKSFYFNYFPDDRLDKTR
jgi:hypothetical protein